MQLVLGSFALWQHPRRDLHFSTVPFTSRAPKEGEIEGKDYNFVSREVFEEVHRLHTDCRRDSAFAG
jgi:guanylate kinase